MSVIYLKHRTRTGGLHEMNADVYNRNIKSISQEWRPASIAEIKDAGYQIEEVKPKKKTKKQPPKEEA